MKRLVLFFLLNSIVFFGMAQVGVGTVSPDASSVLDISATDKGLLVPRVSLSDVADTTLDGTNTAATGLLIYNTNASVTGGSGVGYYYFNGANWDKLVTSLTASSDIDWYEEGTTTAPNDINDDMYTLGNLAIGKNTADYPLDVSSTTDTRGANFDIGGTTNGTIYGNYVNNDNTGTGTNIATGNFVGGTATSQQIGSYSNITNSGDGTHYGVRSLLNGNGDGLHYGGFHQLTGTGGNAHIGVGTNLGSTGTGAQYGVQNVISNSGDAQHYGVHNALSGSGTGPHYGVLNLLSGSGTGVQYGILNSISNTGTTQLYGTFNQFIGNSNANRNGSFTNFSGSGTGNQTGYRADFSTSNSVRSQGFSTVLGGTNNGAQSGYYALVSNSGTGSKDGIELFFTGDNGAITGISSEMNNDNTSSKTGLLNTISGNGTGSQKGVSNVMAGTGSGIQYGVENIFSNTEDGSHWGAHNTFSGSGSGIHTGVYSNFTAGTGNLTGVWTDFMGSVGNGNLIGAFNQYSAGGNGILAGIYTNILSSVSGTGMQYGAYTSLSGTGGGDHWGTYSTLAGSGTGTKYGTQVVIAAAAGGTHYGIHSEVRKTGSYAGYFLGDMLGDQRLELTSTTIDATPTAGSGIIELGGNLRLDGNEIITNTGNTLFLQFDNGGNIRADGSTFYLDGTNNRVGIGTIAPDYTLEVSGPVMLEDTAAPSALAGHSGIYSRTGELTALDEAGNATIISPHHFSLVEPSEEMAWSFYSKNERIGKEVNVDMLRVVRLVEQLSGEQLVHLAELGGKTVPSESNKNSLVEKVKSLSEENKFLKNNSNPKPVS